MTTVRNSLLVNNSNRNCYYRGIRNGGYNLSDDQTCANGVITSYLKLDPEGLQDNGGPTRTIALLPTSPAINAIPEGENGCGTTFTTDQRGISRPQRSRCDIGAFEKRSTEGQ